MSKPLARILYVEDEPDIRTSLSASLREAGYVVDEAERALEAGFDGSDVEVTRHENAQTGGVDDLRVAGFDLLELDSRDLTGGDEASQWVRRAVNGVHGDL